MSNQMMTVMMGWEGCARKQFLQLRYHPSICLKGLKEKKDTKILTKPVGLCDLHLPSSSAMYSSTTSCMTLLNCNNALLMF
jgi:hypothetical protein